MSSLKEIIDDIDIEELLIDSNGQEWSIDNIDTSEDKKDYCLDSDGIWELDGQGYRQSAPVYKFKSNESA